MALFEPGPPPEETAPGKVIRRKQRFIAGGFVGVVGGFIVAPFVAAYLGMVLGIFVRVLEFFA